MSRAARITLRIIAVLWLLGLAAMLCSCGGGDPEDDGGDARIIQPPACAASSAPCK